MRRLRTGLALLVVLLPPALQAETISPGVYRERLTRIEGGLRAGDWVGAKTKARRLLEDRIAFGRERLEPDRSVLGPIAAAPNAKAARAAAPALHRLVASFPAEAVDDRRAAEPDSKLLAEVRKREALAELPQGGRMPEVHGGFFAALAGFLEPIAQAMSDFVTKLWEWFLDLIPDAASGQGGATLNFVLVVTLLVALALVLSWVGWKVIRNRRRGAAPAEAGPAPLPPATDDDPLSREANEWERYARELAAAGRAREAIRAWYHAVLVALYRGGTLHYRKGRTNWEYVSAVPPGTTWRSTFVELTRHFEREWYGRDRSTPEALRESEAMALGLLSSAQGRAA
ncbi:MAG TPA: DUF4129 domain-containing protein [Thermoanaerobaculia bacterium]|nr:DUF4129 domain-containing protein [Thermoanaerobaculia bacterium]